MEELTITEKVICLCSFVICPVIMFLVAKDILKDIKNMKTFGEDMFGRIEETKNINDILDGG